MKNRPIALALAALLPSAWAGAQVAYTFPNGKGGVYEVPSFDAVEGNLFQVGSRDIVVTQLGYEFESINQQYNPAAIFDADTGAILAKATICAGDRLARGYFWQSIQPLTLKAGRKYYVGALHQSGVGNEYWWDTRPATVPRYMSDLGTYFKMTSTIEGGAWWFGGGVSRYGPGETRHYVGAFYAESVKPSMNEYEFVGSCPEWSLAHVKRYLKRHRIRDVTASPGPNEVDIYVWGPSAARVRRILWKRHTELQYQSWGAAFREWLGRQRGPNWQAPSGSKCPFDK